MRVFSTGCEKKFARKDGLVAHLRSSRDSCVDDIADELWHDVLFKIRNVLEYLRSHGTWTCSFEDPRSGQSRGALSSGCGQKFKGALLLEEHLDSDGADDNKCRTELLTHFRIEATRRAVGRALQVPESDEQPRKLHSGPLWSQKVNILNCALPSGMQGNLIRVRLGFPLDVEHWRTFTLDIGGEKIADFKTYFDSSSCQNSMFVKY